MRDTVSRIFVKFFDMKKYLFIVLLLGVWSCEENKITKQKVMFSKLANLKYKEYLKNLVFN